LGVPRNATQGQVKDAWRELVKNWHPHTIKDKTVQEHPDVKRLFEEEFERIMKVYEEIKKARGWN
jgi:curved DNA-binding protein CbpA